jgi:methionine-rich copper-binding protein CopC
MKPLVLLLAAILATMATSASSHAFLERVSPGAGDNVHAGPLKVQLRFSEALEPSFSGIKVTDSTGHDMAAGPALATGTQMELPLRALLPGRYRVSWHAVSIDTHRSEGKYNFQVVP